MKYSNRNIRIPPNKVFIRLKTPAPMSRAKKKSFRSTPRMVSGRLSERNTGLVRLVCMSGSGKEPGHEIDGTNGHSDAEDDAGHGAFRSALAKGENQSAHDDSH